MGWNSWNRFQGNISEILIEQVASAMATSGMRDAGYEYVNLDDMWQATSRDASGNIVPDPQRFPSGMKALADYVHCLGLKIGIYSDRGTQTCSGRPGSYGYETQDAQTYAAWGIDYLKYDNCNAAPGSDLQTDYTTMGLALAATGRPVVFSLCAWWFYPWEPTVGNLWRTTTDITDTWTSFTSLLDKNGGDTSQYADSSYAPPGLSQYAGPGHWNDPDMLEVGNGGMTDTEDQTQFSMWAMMAAPLITGNDPRFMSQATHDTLTNADVIAVDQDPLGQQGQPISASPTLEVWKKQLVGVETYAVALLNRTDDAANITVAWSELGLTSGIATVRDLWAKQDLGLMIDQYTAAVPSHGVVMLEVVGQ
jgi:alpha-galactosidase